MAKVDEGPSEINLCVKYFLFFTNLMTWVWSLILVGAGLWAWFERGAFDSSDTVNTLIESPIVDPSWWLVVIGTLIFFIATTGCLGALRENTILLTLYKVALGIILLLEIGGAVAIYFGFYFYQDEIKSTAADYLSDITIKGYRDNADFQDLLDTIQTEVQCCGASGYNDWQDNIYFNCSETAVSAHRNPEACGVPYSCCRPSGPVVNTQCGYNVRKDTFDPVLRKQTIYESGCVDGFSSWLTGRFDLYLLASIGGAILIVEVAGFILAQTLGDSINRQRSKQRY